MRRAMHVGMLCAALTLLGEPMAHAQTGNLYQGTLWAGQSTDSGTFILTVSDNCGSLMVQLYPNTDWEIAGYHVDIVSDEQLFPVNKGGNPKLGHFQWNASFPPTTVTQTFFVLPDDVIDPISSCGQEIFVAIHADMVEVDSSGQIVREESAWGGPEWSEWDPNTPLPSGFFEFPGRRWGFYLAFLWNAAPTPTPTPVLPTPTFTPVPPTSTPTPVPPTSTSTPIPPTSTATMTPTPLPPTPTPTPVPPTPTFTPVPPTLTPTPIPPTPTATMTPTPIPPTPTFTPTPIVPTPTATMTQTPIPPTPTPV